MNSRITTLAALAVVAAVTSACSGSSSSTVSPIVTSSTTTTTTTTSGALAFTLSTTSLSEGQTISLSATGGVGAPYYYCIMDGYECNPSYVPDMGSINDINLSNPTYTAPDDAATVTLEVLDSFGDTASATLTIGSGSGTGTSGGGGTNPTPVVISPAAGNYTVNQAITLTTTGGTPPYTYSIAGGSGGTFGNQTTNQVIFTAPSSPGSVVIQVTDSESLVATSTLTFNAINGLTITPGSATVGTGQTLVFEAFGGTGPYVFTTENGVGSFVGSTYFAGAVPATATIEVTDKGTGKTATTSLQVTATYSTTQMSPSTFQVELGRYIGITYDFNSSATTPSFEIFGAGPTHDGNSVGYDPNEIAICDGAAAPCAENVPLTNYVAGVPATYRGDIVIVGADNNVETVGYCIAAATPTVAYLNQAPSGGTNGQFYEQVEFTDSAHNGNNTLFGGDMTETFFTYYWGSSHYAGWASITFSGGYTYNANCSDFPSTNDFVQVGN